MSSFENQFYTPNFLVIGENNFDKVPVSLQNKDEILSIKTHPSVKRTGPLVVLILVTT